MRTVRLGRTFDAVLVHDAIDYMTTEADLRAAVETAYAHCRPGVALFVPDDIAETSSPAPTTAGDGATCATSSGAATPTRRHLDGDRVRRSCCATRTARPRGPRDAPHAACSPRATVAASCWREVGFATAEAVLEETTEDREPRVIRACR